MKEGQESRGRFQQWRNPTLEFSLLKWSPPLKNNSLPSSPINKTNFSHPFRLTHTHMHFQVISGYLKDVCMPDAFKFCQSQPSSLVLVASERRQENSAWNSEDKQGLLPGRVVSLKHCWLLLHLIQRLSSHLKPGDSLPGERSLKFYFCFTYSVKIHSTNIVEH